ncbi:MAG: tail fiber domain-containing protein, partial [Pseudomonadota bacterium]
MPWGVAAAAAVSVVGGMMGNKSAKKAQQAAAAQAQREQDMRTATAAPIAARGAEEHAWSQDLAAQNQARLKSATDKLSGLSGTLEASAQAAGGMYSGGGYKDIDERVAADALGFDSEARKEAEAARSAATVGQSFDAAQGREGTRLARYGLRPEDTIGASNAELAKAGAQATAMNETRRNVELTGIGLRQQAQQAGRGIQQYGLAATGAAGGLAAQSASLANAGAESLARLRRSDLPYMTSAAQIATGGSQAGTMQQNSALAQGAANQQSGAISEGAYNIAGAYLGNKAGQPTTTAPAANELGQADFSAGYYSSKKVKHSKRPVSGKAALSAVNKTKVESWKYKKGVADGGSKRHVGPYAEDVQKNMGDAAAPGGKAIDPISMGGVTMSAVKELSAQVDKIAKKVGMRDGARRA